MIFHLPLLTFHKKVNPALLPNEWGFLLPPTQLILRKTYPLYDYSKSMLVIYGIYEFIVKVYTIVMSVIFRIYDESVYLCPLSMLF